MIATTATQAVYTGKVNYDARTGCHFTTVEGETYRVLDSFPNWLHFANVKTGERFNADYDRLIELNAMYTASPLSDPLIGAKTMIYEGYQLPPSPETIAENRIIVLIEKHTKGHPMHELEWQENGVTHRLEQHSNHNALYVYYRNGDPWDVGTPEGLAKAHDFNIPTIRVKFVIFQGCLTALFPDEIADNAGNITCYAHIGQHSAANKSLMRCKRATPAQYEPLLRELTQIYAPTALKII